MTRAPSNTVTVGACAWLETDHIVNTKSANSARFMAPTSPRRIASALIGPLGAPLVVDPPLAEQPLAVHLHELVFVMAIAVEDRLPLRVVVAVVEPVRAPRGLVSVDLEDDVRDVVPSRARTQATLGRPRIRHLRDDVVDRLAPANLAGADVEHAVFRERGDIEIRVAKVHCEEIPRLEIFNGCAILCVAVCRR